MTVRPINRKYLPSVAEVRVPYTDANGYQGLEDPVTIVGVAYERCASTRATSYMLQDGTTGLMFVDAINSDGAFDIPAGSMVRIDGEAVEQCANAVHRFDAPGGRVHHWEVELR